MNNKTHFISCIYTMYNIYIYVLMTNMCIDYTLCIDYISTPCIPYKLYVLYNMLLTYFKQHVCIIQVTFTCSTLFMLLMNASTHM